MTVCFISHSADLHGAERSLIEAIEALRSRGIDCRVVLPRHGPLTTELQRRGIVWAVVPYTWWMSTSPSWLKTPVKLGLNLLAAIPLAILIAWWRADVVYTNSAAVVSGALSAFICRRPHIWQLRELAGPDHSLYFDLGERTSARAIGTLSAACIVASNTLAERYRPHLPAGRITVVPQFVRGPLTRGAAADMDPSERPLFVIIGRIQEGKRQDEAILALAAAASSGYSADLWIVGTGSDAMVRSLRQLAVEHDVAARVRFTGEVADAYPCIVVADAVLVCSRGESFGRVTAEAMLCGKPVIAARSGATPELVSDGHTGLLYEPGDINGLATHMRSIIDHPDCALVLGSNAMAVARKKFCPVAYGDALAAVVAGALGKSHGTSAPERNESVDS